MVLLMLAILFGARPVTAGIGTAFWLLLATVLLVLLQLVPCLPTSGRRCRAGSAARSTPRQATWRPWSIVPWATINAASSLIVPVVAFYLVSALRDEEKAWLPTILLGVIFLSMLVGLLQFSGFAINNPFLNDSVGGVSGIRQP
ncbi:hypothetical protein [Novosphingobium panipatense]|uniref:hypothetical protein n=1 Tax=Novosphingobium panipatense TaxID=428991 RepID=UPI0036083541